MTDPTPQRCCPHCDADLAPAHAHGELSPCWLCRKPLPPGLRPAPAPASPAPAPAASRPGVWDRILLGVAIAIAVAFAIPAALAIALFVVCMASMSSRSPGVVLAEVILNILFSPSTYLLLAIVVVLAVAIRGTTRR